MKVNEEKLRTYCKDLMMPVLDRLVDMVMTLVKNIVEYYPDNTPEDIVLKQVKELVKVQADAQIGVIKTVDIDEVVKELKKNEKLNKQNTNIE